jgi:ubiquitin carboxyl-terminal hydrolase 7
VEEAWSKYGNKTTNFRLWMEKADGKDDEGNIVFKDKSVDLRNAPNNRPLMLFLKHFDASSQSLYGVGNFYAAYQDRVLDLSPAILKMMGWPTGTNLRLHEVSGHKDNDQTEAI